MKKLIIIVFLTCICFMHATEITNGNRVKEYGKYKIIQYRDFASKEYRQEQIQLITFIDVDYYVVDNLLKLNENIMYGFNLYGLYFCLATEVSRNTLFNKSIFGDIFATTLYHHVGSEISEIYESMYIVKNGNHLTFYDGDKYIFEIYF